MRETKIKLTDSQQKQICIGRTGEHDVNLIRIDITHYTDIYGDVSASAVVSGSMYKQGYPVLCTQDGTEVTIPVTDAMTRHAQSYLEVRMRTTEGLAKSEVVKLICRDALPNATGNTPSPVADWIERAEKLLNDLAESGVDASVIEKALADYLQEHPIEIKGLTEDDVRAIVETYGYLTEDRDTVYDDTGIRRLIDGKADKEHVHERYLTEHQSLEGYAKTEELQTLIEEYFRDHPTEDKDTTYAFRFDSSRNALVVTPKGGASQEIVFPVYSTITQSDVNDLIDAKLTPLESLSAEIMGVI